MFRFLRKKPRGMPRRPRGPDALRNSAMYVDLDQYAAVRKFTAQNSGRHNPFPEHRVRFPIEQWPVRFPNEKSPVGSSRDTSSVTLPAASRDWVSHDAAQQQRFDTAMRAYGTQIRNERRGIDNFVDQVALNRVSDRPGWETPSPVTTPTPRQPERHHTESPPMDGSAGVGAIEASQLSMIEEVREQQYARSPGLTSEQAYEAAWMHNTQSESPSDIGIINALGDTTVQGDPLTTNDQFGSDGGFGSTAFDLNGPGGGFGSSAFDGPGTSGFG